MKYSKSSNHKSTFFSQFQIFTVFLWRGFGENEVKCTGGEEMSRLEALEVGKACYVRLQSYSRFKKREPLIALGSDLGGSEPQKS